MSRASRLSGLSLIVCDHDRFAISGDPEGARVGRGAGKFAVKGDRVMESPSTPSGVDVERLSSERLGAVSDGQVEDRGEVVTRCRSSITPDDWFTL